jgi:hypothetical protein
MLGPMPGPIPQSWTLFGDFYRKFEKLAVHSRIARCCQPTCQ